MHVKSNGYVSGSYLFLSAIRKIREHVELEKFMCRVLKDDDRTREFKRKTETHKDPIHSLRYNNQTSNRLTAAGRKRNLNGDS